MVRESQRSLVGAHRYDLASRRNVALVATFAALAGVAVLVATRHGPYLSPDSVTYYSMARHLARGDGVSDFTDTATTVFPPGYPFLLATGLRLHLTLDTSARVCNALCVPVTVVLAWRVLRDNVAGPHTAVLGVVPIAFSAVMLDIARHSWSEPIFCPLMLVFVVLLHRAVLSVTPARAAAAGLVVAVALLVRYAALSLLASGVVALVVLLPWSIDGKRRAGAVAAFLGGCSLFVPWLVRNEISAPRAALGPRFTDPTPLGTLAIRLLGAVGQVVAPVWALERTALAAIVIGAVLVVLASAWTTIVWTRRATRRMAVTFAPADELVRRREVLLRILVIVTCVYCALLLVSAKTSGSSIDQRTAAPLAPLGVLIGVLVLDRQSSPSSARRTRHFGRIGASVFAWVTFGLFVAAAAAPTDATATVPEHSRPGSLAAKLAAFPVQGLLVTNHPWTLTAEVGYEPLRPYPPRNVAGVSIVPATHDDLLVAACTRPAEIAWFASRDAPPPALGVGLTTTPRLRGDDGVLYEIDPTAHACDAMRHARLGPRGRATWVQR